MTPRVGVEDRIPAIADKTYVRYLSAIVSPERQRTQ
jgi:hypothetical protein